jgi:hypothetical protein
MRSLRQRCSNPRNPLFPRYGARGFTVCSEWESYWTFYDWAIDSGYRPGLNIEVVGRSRRFSPKTCRWISAQQRMHRDGYPGGRSQKCVVRAFGEEKPVAEWARDQRCTVSADVVRARLRKGVPPERAITLPKRSVLPKDGRRARAPKGPRKFLDWRKIVGLHTRSGLAPREIAERMGSSESAIRRGLKARREWGKPVKLGPHAPIFGRSGTSFVAAARTSPIAPTATTAHAAHASARRGGTSGRSTDGRSSTGTSPVSA